LAFLLTALLVFISAHSRRLRPRQHRQWPGHLARRRCNRSRNGPEQLPRQWSHTGLDQDQRGDVASALQAEWQHSRQASERFQREADNNFQTAIINRSLGGEDLLAWKDPKTGLSPSQDVSREGIQWLANGGGSYSSNDETQGAISPQQSNPDALVQLTGDITGGRLPDSVPINRHSCRVRLQMPTGKS